MWRLVLTADWLHYADAFLSQSRLELPPHLTVEKTEVQMAFPGPLSDRTRVLLPTGVGAGEDVPPSAQGGESSQLE